MLCFISSTNNYVQAWEKTATFYVSGAHVELIYRKIVSFPWSSRVVYAPGGFK